MPMSDVMGGFAPYVPWTVLISAGLIGAARVRTRTEDEGMLGEMECEWRLAVGDSQQVFSMRAVGTMVNSPQDVRGLARLGEDEGLGLGVAVGPRLVPDAGDGIGGGRQGVRPAEGSRGRSQRPHDAGTRRGHFAVISGEVM